MNIDLYREAVIHLAKSKANSRFSNKGNAHAEVLVQQLFLHADKTVRWFTGKLAEDFVTSEFIAASIHKFLSKPDARLLVLSESAIDPKSVALLRQFPDKVSLKVLTASLDKPVSSSKHFIVTDALGYRLETHDQNREAVANFNEPELALKLVESFESLVESGSDSVNL
jgi:hypothetical protein